MAENATISIAEIGQNNFFITIFKGEKNLVSDLELCQYRDEMDYWGYSLSLCKHNNEYGYICSKESDRDGLILETERILKKYKLF